MVALKSKPKSSKSRQLHEASKRARAGSRGNQRGVKHAERRERDALDKLKVSTAWKRLDATVRRYVANVTSGQVVAGKLVRQAVARYLTDLERFEHSPQRAARVANFIQKYCRHTSGQFSGRRFKLEPWQLFIIWALFGFIDAQGFRRFKYALISVARKNGKTAFAAALVIAMQCVDEPREQRSQMYAAATKMEQGAIVFDEVEAMIRADEQLRQLYVRYHKRLLLESTESQFRVISADKPFDGLGPQLVVLDELHAWTERHRKFFGTMKTGSGAKRQPLAPLVITTAGDDDSDIYNEEVEYGRKVLDGQVVDDAAFFFIAELDKDDDIHDPANWPKANPNLGVSVRREYLEQLSNEAEHKPSAVHDFTRYHCNRATLTVEHVFTRKSWSRGGGQLPADLVENPCWLGLDLGRVYDWAALAEVFRVDEDQYAIRAQCWTAEETKLDLNREPLCSLVEQGTLIIHPGRSVDFAEIERYIGVRIQKLDVQQLAFDSHGAKTMATKVCNDWNVPAFEFYQSFIAYNEPMKAFIKAIEDGRLRHGDDDSLTWQALNLQRKSDPAGRWMPNKASGRKIDGIVAAIMAFRLALLDVPQTLDYYETHEVELI